MTSLLELAKRNIFANPFLKTASCESRNEPSLPQPKSALIVPGPIPSRKIAFAATDEYSTEFGSPMYYALCGVAGAICCGATHTGITPLDLVKCRMQVDPAKYPSLLQGVKVTLSEDGVKGLVRGWGPTLAGYSVQGTCKFGFYELFKNVYADMVGPYNAYHYRSGIYLAASATAEAIADVFLSPFESVKVRIQTQPGFVSSMREAIPIIMAKEGMGGFYKSLVPLWGRQIPYTMMKFASFEKTVELLYQYVVPKPRELTTKGEQLMVTFSAGYIAGVFCAVVSHPADTMVSKLQKKGTTIGSVYKQIGMRGLWAGLGTRIIMIGTLTAAQWFIYDAFKVMTRMPRPPPPSAPPSK